MEIATAIVALVFIIFGTIESIVIYLFSSWKIFVIFIFFFYTIIILSRRIENLENEKQYSLNRIYDEKNKLIGHEWIQVIEDGHWVTMVFDEINGRFINVKHHRTDKNLNKKYKNKEDIIKEDKTFNLEQVFGFEERKILYKKGKFWRYK